MATGTDSTCPICQETWDDAASALPCRHKFCLGCILRWAMPNASCPLCRTLIETVRFSERGEQDYIQFVITSPAESEETSSQQGRTSSHLDQNSSHGPVPPPAPSPQVTLPQAEQGSLGQESVGGLLPEVWAGLFRQYQHLLEPVRPWLRRKLHGIFRGHWWLAEAAESFILRDLCLHGPQAAILVLRLQNRLEQHTAPLVRGLIHVIVARCSREAKRLLRFRRARQDNSTNSTNSSCPNPRARTPASGHTGSNTQGEAGTSQSSPQGNHSCPQPVPNPAEQEQPQRRRNSRRGHAPVPRAASTAPVRQGRDHSSV